MWWYFLDLAGVVVVAISGCLAAARKKLDLLAAVFFAILTGVGGGTLRDLLLGEPVFWVQQPNYVLAATGAGVITFFWVRFFPVPHGTLRFADSLALGFFTVLGVEKALAVGAHPVIATMMGVATGVAGGAIRDVLASETPMILGREIYVTASLAGAALLVAFHHFSLAPDWGWIPAFLLTVGLRLAAIRWNLQLPSAVTRD